MSAEDGARPPTFQRALILVPVGGNAAQLQRVLAQAGLKAQVCEDITDLCQSIEAGAGALLLTSEALALDPMGMPAAGPPARLVAADGDHSRWLVFPQPLVTRLSAGPA